jgi:hypothetical protein
LLECSPAFAALRLPHPAPLRNHAAHFPGLPLRFFEYLYRAFPSFVVVLFYLHSSLSIDHSTQPSITLCYICCQCPSFEQPYYLYLLLLHKHQPSLATCLFYTPAPEIGPTLDSPQLHPPFLPIESLSTTSPPPPPLITNLRVSLSSRVKYNYLARCLKNSLNTLPTTAPPHATFLSTVPLKKPLPPSHAPTQRAYYLPTPWNTFHLASSIAISKRWGLR